MKWKTILITALVLAVSAASGATEKDSQGRYQTLSDTLSSLTLDVSSTRQIEGVFIERGVITITLESGVMSAMHSIDNKVIGYVFNGKGTAVFQPRILTEQVNLERFYGQKMFMEDITSAMFLCTDETINEQFALFENSPSDDTSANIAYAKLWTQFAMEGDGDKVPSSFARTNLNSLSEGFFQAHLLRASRANEMSVYVVRDPFEIEPYTLFIEKLGNKFVSPIMVNRCPEPNVDRVMNDNGVDHGDLVETLQHTLTVQLDRSLDMVARDRLAMEVVADSLQVLDLMLHPNLEIDSITVVRGTALPTFRHEDSYTTWVELPRTFKKGEPLELVITYHGDIIDRRGDYTILRSSVTWYPSHSYKHKAFYDATFEFPENMTLSGVGSQNELRVNEDRKHSRWVTGRRIRNASFHIGLFKRHTITPSPGVPPASILYNTPDQVETIGIDIKQSMEFFTKFYGQLPIDSLVATELPGWHGEAFPGLLHLSSQAFDPSTWDDEQFFEEQFIAHEVGHQWWGIAVDFESYRDQWLSEGFSEYSALMYSQFASGDPDKFFRLLKMYREDILDFGKRAIGKDLGPPPIALGQRANIGARGRRGYSVFIYNKGAWVLHMLRNLLLDLDTMKEDAFMSVLKSFYHSHKNRRATTDDFRKTVEDVVGRDMQWFFNQWVYGNQIPEFTWAYSSSEQTNGTFANKIRVTQEGVEETFRSYIPIKVIYDDGTWQRFRVQMIGRQATLQLPESASEIDEIIFNEFMSVLCEQDEESF